jgi:hypothetical protein
MLPHSEKIPGLDYQQDFLKFSFSASLVALLISLLHAIALGLLVPKKRLVGPIPEKIA